MALVQAELTSFRQGPLNHDLGPEGPGDADDDAAAACICAAEAFLERSPEAALWCASRVIDAASLAAELDHLESYSMVAVDEATLLCAPRLQAELAWLVELIEQLSEAPVTGDFVTAMRAFATR